MVANLTIPDDCYSELEKLRAEVIADKKTRNINPKTSYGECICLLIREHKEKKKFRK